VVTFDKNPAAVVNPASAPPRLTDVELKLELLKATGVDQILVLEFDAERAKEKAEDFVTEILVNQLSARVVVVGDDFHFGNQRQGNVALLRLMGAQAGFSVEPVHLVSDERAHEVVSSTRIRGLIARGELAEATALLGRPHEVRGTVVVPEEPATSGRSRLLVEVPGEILLPPAGEYEGSAGADSSLCVAARLVVGERVGKGPQSLDISAIANRGVPTAVRAAKGELVRARFG